MKSLYENILGSTKSGINKVITTNPEEFASVFLKAGYYFVSENRVFVTEFENKKKFVIDKDFPDVQFNISSLGCRGGKIIIEDWQTLEKYFKYKYGPVEIGGDRTIIYIRDENAV